MRRIASLLHHIQTLTNLGAIQQPSTRKGAAVVVSIGKVDFGITTSAEKDIQERKYKNISSTVGTVSSQVLLPSSLSTASGTIRVLTPKRM
jgi:hypothetical protein